jgi:signal peptidase II
MNEKLKTLKEKLKAVKVLLKFPIFEAVIFALAIFADILSKNLTFGVHTSVLGSFLRFDSYKNEGAAFSFLADKAWAPTFFLVLSGLVIPAIGVYLYFSRKNGIVCRVSLSLIIAGAVGNLIDRIFLGYVRDFISFSFFNPVFNVADSCLTVGIALFLVYYIFIYKDPKKKPAADTAQGGEPPPDTTDDTTEN